MINDWIEFDTNKPDVDRLFVITNGKFAEIAYYEDGEIMKPWRYDKHDKSTFNSKNKGLKYQYINLQG